MTNLQEILYEHCPQMDVVDIIIDYKTDIEKNLILCYESRIKYNKTLNQYNKTLNQYNKKPNQSSEELIENNNIISIINEELTQYTKEIQQLIKENLYLFKRIMKFR